MKNSDTIALVDGDCVMGDQTAADGISVKQSTGALTLFCVGVIAGKDVQVGEFGKVQVFGYHGNAKTAGATAGLSLTSSGTAGTMVAGGTADPPISVLGYAITTTAGSRSKVWLRCM
jgi:hypothetical protein